MVLILLMSVVIALQLAGQLMIKRGLGRLPAPVRQRNGFRFVAGILSQRLVLFGLGALTLWYLFYLGVLTRFDVSQCFPLSALDTVLFLLAARIFLAEKVPLGRWAGACLIVAGVWLVAHS